jgi:hypothetical protein
VNVETYRSLLSEGVAAVRVLSPRTAMIYLTSGGPALSGPLEQDGNWMRHAYSTERTRIVVPKGPPLAT